jgi:tetratricopeptide (TPR) repeat protein
MKRGFMRFIFALVGLTMAGPLAAQIPEKFENLQVLPKDISRDSLVQTMRGFSFALNVRCQHCHSGGDGVSFAGVNFAADDKDAKKSARFMLKMVNQLNTQTLAGLEKRSDPPVRVVCVTCHRGSALPKTLEMVLAEVIARDGIPAAVQRYRDLRANTMTFGRYDFGEWSMNELARRLAVAGDTAASIAMLELNLEFNPESTSIDAFLGELHEKRGEKDKAIARYERALAKTPNNPELRRRLEALRR